MAPSEKRSGIASEPSRGLASPRASGDTFDTVRGAETLAASERQPQEVFLLSGSVGFLFHPEVEPPTLESWARSFPEALTRSGRKLDDVLTRDLPALRAARSESEALLRRVSDHFAREASRS